MARFVDLLVQTVNLAIKYLFLDHSKFITLVQVGYISGPLLSP
jgi:hypothetical protein